MDKFEKLPNMTVKQSTFIQALAVGKSTQEACRIANISYRTGYKWKKEEGFADTLLKLKSEIVNSSLSKLITALDIAVDKHIEVLEDPKTITSQKLKAIEMLYNQVHWFTDTEEIKQQINELREIQEGRNGGII